MPKFDKVQIIDHTSAFQSFTSKLDLKQKVPSIATRYSGGFITLSYGYEPQFAVFYKDYPIGIADGIDFEELHKIFDNF